MLRDKLQYRSIAGIMVMWLLPGCLSAFAQGPANPPAAGSKLEDTVQALAGEVKELSATIQELRAEVSQSRQETRELRVELHGAMEKLSSTSMTASVRSSSPLETPKARPAAQESPSSPPSPSEFPTEARLNRLEEDQQLLQAKVDEQHQTKIESAGKYRMRLSGIALLNLSGNSGTVNDLDVPSIAMPRAAVATTGSVSATLRQSEIGLEVYGPALAGAQASANVNIDFMGGFSSASNGVTSSLVRLRTATVRLDWAHTSVVGGQDTPFFSPLSPASFASLGYPAFADAGNLWTWTPQIRVEHRLSVSDTDNIMMQGGLLDPLSGEAPYAQYYRRPGGGEQSRAPAVASRLAWIHGAGDRAMTLGVGGYYSRQDYGAGRTMDAWAGTADWNAPLGKHVALSGEFYRGRALGGLGAAQGRSVLFEGLALDPTSEVVGLNSIGGWTQVKFKATEAVEFNAAYGQDNPLARDLRSVYSPISYGYSAIAKNQNALFNVIYRPRSDLLFALEYRYLDTLQVTQNKNKAGILNLSMGLLF